jgi:hypothetical protein
VYALAIPFVLWGVLIVVGGPAAAAWLIARAAAGTGITAIEAVVFVVLIAAMIAGLSWAFARERLHARLRFGRSEATLIAVAATSLALGSFSSLTGMLYREGWLELRFLDGARSGEALTREQILDRSLEFHLWQVADFVPLVDIPRELRWEKPYELENRLGGLLLLVFQGIVIIPLIQVARLIFSGQRRPYEEAVVKALRSVRPRLRIKRIRSALYDEAIIDSEPRVLVDVMQQVSSEEAPLRRLQGSVPSCSRTGARPTCWWRTMSQSELASASTTRSRSRSSRLCSPSGAATSRLPT